MSAFYIWNPYIVPDRPKMLEFMVTNGDVDGIADDREFIQNILKDIGIKAKVLSSSIEAYRTNYYSEYLDEDDWRGIWQAVWKVSVITSKEIASRPKTKRPWTGTNATGHHWLDSPADDAVIGCLVIADFKSEAALKKAQIAIVNNSGLKEMQERYNISTPTFSRSEVLRKYKQIQINLGKFSSQFFAEGADYAERIIELCKKAKGVVHYEDQLE